MDSFGLRHLDSLCRQTPNIVTQLKSVRSCHDSRPYFICAHVGRHNADGKPTGWYAPEAAHPYYVLSEHYDIDFASPKGGKAPLDPSSVEMFKDDEGVKRFLADEKAKAGYEHTKRLSDVDEKDYLAIFYVGGHGPCLDLAEDETSIKLASAFFNAGKPTSAVCHGPAALVNVKDKAGKRVVEGRNVTSFSDEEEEQAGLVDAIPWLVETKLKELGANYSKNPKAWGPKVITDGHLITGANPASAQGTGEAILALLQKK